MPIPLGVLAVAGAGGGGAASSFDLLETTVLGSNTQTVTFSGLGSYSQYKHLQLRCVLRMSDSGNGGGVITLQFNGVTSGYAQHRLAGTGSSVISGANTSTISMSALWATGQNSEANSFGAGVVDILDFSNTNKNTTIRGFTGATSNNQVVLYSGLYPDTTAVTSITVLQSANNYSFQTGSRFSLYGIK